ncbi:MAG TPA: hypothetical protein VMV16_09145 [Solirubrobacteraceae bacterium]|nr:hypothetical protein [Solirubrobacteraceae bacterium]
MIDVLLMMMLNALLIVVLVLNIIVINVIFNEVAQRVAVQALHLFNAMPKLEPRATSTLRWGGARVGRGCGRAQITFNSFSPYVGLCANVT